MVETDKYIFFLKNYLSQWLLSDMIDENGIKYNCCEQYMMYHKALLFNDDYYANKILLSKIPREHKDFGRLIGTGYASKPFDDIIWKQNRIRIVTAANILKFTQNEELKIKLLKTGDKILVEANPKDIIWGVGLAEDDVNILDPNNWKGENLLGVCLMNVRSMIYNSKLNTIKDVS